MDQALLELNTTPATDAERCGFELGWDHAHHGLVPPPELLLTGTPLRQGWQAGRAVFGSRTLAGTLPVRRWLALRIQAWRTAVPFEGHQLTADYLAQIEVSHCPVTRRALGGASFGSGAGDAPVFERLLPQGSFAAGHLVVISRAASQARASCSSEQALATAERLARDGLDEEAGLDVAAWRRLAVLISFVTPLAHAQAAQLPMCVLPPNRVRVLNAAQGLQALVTWQLGSAGWSRRLRQLAEFAEEISGEAAIRHDFQLVVGALAPRVLELTPDAGPLRQRHALEDLWRDARVQRRWSHLVLSLGAADCEHLATRAAAAGLGGVRTLVHDAHTATEAWGSALPSLLKPSRRRQLLVAAWQRAHLGEHPGANLGAAAPAPLAAPPKTAR